LSLSLTVGRWRGIDVAALHAPEVAFASLQFSTTNFSRSGSLLRVRRSIAVASPIQSAPHTSGAASRTRGRRPSRSSRRAASHARKARRRRLRTATICSSDRPLSPSNTLLRLLKLSFELLCDFSSVPSRTVLGGGVSGRRRCFPIGGANTPEDDAAVPGSRHERRWPAAVGWRLPLLARERRIAFPWPSAVARPVPAQGISQIIMEHGQSSLGVAEVWAGQV